ncbi:hypothetical protein PPERSA_08011 [Pseudocohnilembus persalinus]|uniref:Uncharacterized protein n=1 Tax=Pseudocohnilembus persalinus TaxID=266149 RepID=A0A0V0R2E4_PSEPJ|nr:hypothetical protein PPERSA_08011 [Pseudocohnilembus persalinus]|eukprot:KRX08700.1 hypothetical protein PPERSA_08011 [Pseudocohnilembus persalinus]
MDQEIQDTRILPPILIPHKLLTPNNFKYHMQNVDHIYFNPEQSSLHMQQRYGNSRIRKLKPIKKKEDQFFEDNLLYRPKRLSEFDKQYLEKKHFQKIIKLEEFSVIVTFKGFCIELNGGEESEKARKNRVYENLDFQDTHYLGQYSFEYINTFFTRCVSYNEARRKIVLDWESFQKIPYIKSSEQQNQIFPSNLYQDVPNTNMSLELAFPQLNFYINDISHSQKYTCSQEDIKKLIESQFQNLDELLKENFDLQEARNDKDKQNNQYLIKEKQRTENFDRRKSLLTQLKEQQLENQQEQNENNSNIENQEQQKISEEEKQRKEMEEQFNPEDKEIVNSVTKIQAGFRGKKVRNQVKDIKKNHQDEEFKKQFNPDDKDLIDSVTKIQASFKGKKTRNQVKQLQQEKQNNQSEIQEEREEQQFEQQFNPQDKELQNSVTKIQASFKGKKARQEVENLKREKQQKEFQSQFNPEDQNLVNSVTKIQASFKGKKVRNEIQNIKKEKQQEEFKKQFNPQDKELINSITKIQAGFKGKQARNQAKQLKQQSEQYQNQGENMKTENSLTSSKKHNNLNIKNID